MKLKTISANQFILNNFKSATNKKYKLKFRFLNKEGQVINSFKNMMDD